MAAWLAAHPSLAGRTLSIEEIAAALPSYPDGRRARPRVAARRLRAVLRLVERGPNGALGRGATYEVLAARAPEPPARDDIEDQAIEPADGWLADAVRRMTGEDG